MVSSNVPTQFYFVIVGDTVTSNGVPFEVLEDALEHAQQVRQYSSIDSPQPSNDDEDEDQEMNRLYLVKGEYLELDSSSPHRISIKE
jgi:hypothetical protein